MEKEIWQAISRICNYRDLKDLKFVKTQIGYYRLEAERHKGIVRKMIHKDATFIEKELNIAIAEWKRKISTK